MTEADDHVKPIRLFDLSQAEVGKNDFQLNEDEKQHLRVCNECQHVLQVFARQFKTTGSSLVTPNNGEKNQRSGVYRNVCCGQEIVIREGATFPDCPNHPKLSTLWKPIEVGGGNVIALDKKLNDEPAA